MSEFNLRALCSEVWRGLDSPTPDMLAGEVLRRMSADDREAALNGAILAYSRIFAGRRRANRLTLRERLERRSERVGDCLIWTGKTHSNGYGAITIRTDAGPKTRQVHRVSFEEFVGPIPDGFQVDHTCHSADPEACPGRPNCLHIRCWNPEHLRAVTHLENMQGRKSWSGRRTHCPRGHEYTPGNTYSPPSNPSARVCRTCRLERDRRRYQPVRAA